MFLSPIVQFVTFFSQLEDRLDAGFYGSLEMFDADFKLMMDNCKLYNGPDSGE